MVLVPSCLVDPGFAKGSAGIGERAFNKDFAGDIFMSYQGIQPIIIEFKSLADKLRGEPTYQRTNDSNSRVIE